MKTHRKKALDLALSVSLGLGALLGAGTAQAFLLDFDGVQVNVDSQLSYGIQLRTEDRDKTTVGNDNGGQIPVSGAIGELMHGPGGGAAANPDFNVLNGDNGNLNYDAGQLVSGAIKGTHELGLRYDGWEFLGRISWLHDHAVGDTNYVPLSQAAKDVAETNFTPLDLWISKDFEIFGKPTKVRLGNQVVSWGEDVFILGGINSVNALDIRRFHTPGTQLKEVFRPAPMFYFNTSLTDAVSLEGYYEFLWNGFRFDPVGTFFSGADVVGKGQLPAYAPTSFGLCAPLQCGDGVRTPALPGANIVPIRNADVRPRDGGQFGFALRYIADSIDSEFAFYYERYHDKLPFTSFTFDPRASSLLTPGSQANLLGLQYFNEYGQSKNLFGFSANTKVGPVAVGTELSYRPEDSVAIDPTVPTPAGLAAGFGFPFKGLAPGSKGLQYSVMDGVSCGLGTGDPITPGATKVFDPRTCRTTVRGFVEEEKFQAHLTGFYFIENNSIIGDWMRVVGASEGYVLTEIAATYYPNLDQKNIPYLVFPSYAVPDEASAGYVVELGLTYPDLLFGGNVSPQIDFAHDFSGTTPNALPFIEDRKSVYVGVNFDWQSKYKANIGYSSFFGGGLSNIIKDRDFFAASVTYAF